MPIYEYQCKDCDHQFDTLQKMFDEALRDCPECMQPTLTKLVSASSFRLSGSGWYETDFKTDKDKKKNLTDRGKKTEAKSDAKVQNKTDSKKESSTTKTEKPGKTDKSSSSTGTAKAAG